MGIKETAVGAALAMGVVTGLGTPSNPCPTYSWEQLANAVQAEKEACMNAAEDDGKGLKEPDVAQFPY